MPQRVEVHRLAVAGREAGIARELSGRIGRVWLARSRFADVIGLTESTLTLGADAEALYQLGRAKLATGSSVAALVAYDRGLGLYRASHDRGGEAATLSNIGGVYAALGQPQQALDYYQQALLIRRELGDRAGEATTHNNVGGVYAALGQLQRALDHYQQALLIRRELGDRAGEATTHTNIGSVYAARATPSGPWTTTSRRCRSLESATEPSKPPRITTSASCTPRWGDPQRALDPLPAGVVDAPGVGDRAGEATTLNNIGLVYNALGDGSGRWPSTSRPCPCSGRSGTGPAKRPRASISP